MGKASGSTIIPAIEFRRDTDPPASLRRRLAATTPTPFLRSVALHRRVIRQFPSPRAREMPPTWLCAVKLHTRPNSSTTAERSLANWCKRHVDLIRDCRAAGMTVHAEIRVWCYTYIVTVRLDPEAIAELAELDIPISVIYHASA